MCSRLYGNTEPVNDIQLLLQSNLLEDADKETNDNRT